MIPSQPAKLDRPFCNNGNKATIPVENNGASGLASLSLGFPPITERPLTVGGIPPKRTDFNGILNLLSAFCFYQQSGGIFTYDATKNYVTPAIVQHSGVLWYCKRENGVDSTNGVKEPNSTNSTYWVRLIDFILDQASKSVGTPIGTIIMWASNNNPADGGVWLDCNGQSCAAYPQLVSVLGSNTVPNLQGLFPRCVGSQNVGGTTHSASLLNKEGDAIRNITGTISASVETYVGDITGAFYQILNYATVGAHEYVVNGVGFDASRVVPTAYENRPACVGLRFLIKAQ